MKCILECLLFTWTYCAETEASNTILYRFAVHAVSFVCVWSNVLSICTLSAAERVSHRCYIYIKTGFSPPGFLTYGYIFFLHEHEWVPLMLLYILHGEEKEIEFHWMLGFVWNTFLLGRIELFLKYFRNSIHVLCRPIVLPLCVPLTAIVDQNYSCLWYS